MTRIAVLGTGLMGFPMARRLLAAGHVVRAWNRTGSKALPLADHGAIVTSEPAEAVSGTDVVVTMLSDGDAVERVMRDAGPATEDHTLWLQMSTVGVQWAERLEDDARLFELGYVDAPVLGSRKPAQQGELVVLASGPDELKDLCAPIFSALAKRVLWVGEAGAGNRLKVVVNAWLLTLVGALGESVALAEALDVDPRLFLAAIDGEPVGAPYAQAKGTAMVEQQYPPSFPLKHAAKDARLVLAAARDEHLRLKVATAVAERFTDAVKAGLGDEDVSAVRRVIASRLRAP